MLDIALTSTAAARVAAIRDRQGRPDARLRLIVDGGGCAGFQYRFELTDTATAADVEVKTDGVGLLVDDISLPLVSGSVVDYVEDLTGASFQVRNPNAQSACGCGTSFRSDRNFVKIATFNVNGISARLPRLLEWLQEARPDIVGLQEIKIETERFPTEELMAAGYHSLIHGQKGFNGVAILSREPAVEISRALPGDDEDIQARWLEAKISDLHFVCLYLPNGNPVPGDKFDYKLAWMDRLAFRAQELWAQEAATVLAGDWNVCPTDQDAARPDAMAGDALVLPASRSRFRSLVASGWTDAIRAARPTADVYSYWDYQAGAWPRNWGLRIDHLLLCPAAADRMRDCGIDSEQRGRERPSDHVPVWAVLD